jgi:hypothetical protein
VLPDWQGLNIGAAADNRTIAALIVPQSDALLMVLFCSLVSGSTHVPSAPLQPGHSGELHARQQACVHDQ